MILKDTFHINLMHLKLFLKDQILFYKNYLMLQILSNGKYKAVLHRTTVDKEKTRMSWPVFLEPPGEFVVGPLPQLVDQQNLPKYKAKKFKDYSYCKLNKLPQ